jgi:hypothetical protein
MSFCPEQLHVRDFRVPQEDRGVFIDPPWEDFAGLVAANVRLHNQCHYDFQGMPLEVLRRQAREELLAAARQWTGSYRDVPAMADSQAELLFLAGHQPELFHPGVWAKNFALGRLAQEHGAVAINLVVDSDTMKSLSLRVPGGTPEDPRAEMIPLDRAMPLTPYEERPIVDRELLASFGAHAARQMASLVADPLIRQFWPLVLARSGATGNLGQCLAQARHQLEGQWGLETLEVPQSRVCNSLSFCRFTAHLLAQLPRFVEAYNGAVADYRAWHKIRNAAHPVPDLAVDDGWLEAPLWIWTTETPQRRRLFARQVGREVQVTDRQSLTLRLPLAADGDGAVAAAQLYDLAGRGVKIRSRALVTTLWARLVLGQVFIHGIGGAKYDQVTDLLIERFFRLPPPATTVISATLHLPVRRPATTHETPHAVREQLRQLLWQPERYLETLGNVETAEAAALVTEKRRWIAAPADHFRRRWRAIRQINERLQPYVAAERTRLLRLQNESAQHERAAAILNWRQYAFCLYLADTLQEFFAGLLPKKA